jgi:hypothetical protein
MRYGELVFSVGRTTRGTILTMMVGIGYLFLLVFGPLVAEKWMDPQERQYGVLKFVWYGLWIIVLTGLFFFPVSGAANLSLWQNIQALFMVLSLRLTSLLVYFGASLEQSKIVALIVSLSGLGTATVWIWQRLRTRLSPTQ